MKQTRTVLMSQFVGILMAVLLVSVSFETGILEDGILAGADAQLEFVILSIMELLTIAFIPLALRLLKFKKIEADLRQRHAVALRKWGVLRLSMLDFVLLFNTLFYYLFLNTSFGYMAIILVLCLCFVYPSVSRCEEEAFENIVEEA